MWYYGSDEFWDIRDIAVWDVWAFGVYNVTDVGCLGYHMLEMRDVWDVEVLGCLVCRYGLLGMWNIRDVKCSACGRLNVGCWRCGIFRVWNVQDVECLKYQLWDICWDRGCLSRKCRSCDVSAVIDIKQGFTGRLF